MNNVFYRYRVAQEISALEESIAEQKEKIARLEVQKRELFGNERKLERFAREKYLMKRDGEDIFVIVDDNQNKKEEE
jgi:cell division protein FtsB